MFNNQSCWTLVDVSFMVNYACHATFVKYKDAYSEVCGPEFDPVDVIDSFETEMLAYFEHQLPQAIAIHCPIVAREKIIYCYDCPRPEIWRKDVFEGYKSGRDKKPRKFNMKPIHAVVEKWINLQCENYKSQVARVDRCEGDDLLYHFTHRILNETTDSVINVSGDFDICTLLGDRVRQVHPDGTDLSLELMYEKLEKKHKMQIEFPKTAENFLHFKILTGDSSDSIPSVRPRKMGPKTAPKYIGDLELLGTLLKEDVDVLNAYKRNTTLIKMKCIPGVVTKSINEATSQITLGDSPIEDIDAIKANLMSDVVLVNEDAIKEVMAKSGVEYKADEPEKVINVGVELTEVLNTQNVEYKPEEVDLDALLKDVLGE